MIVTCEFQGCPFNREGFCSKEKLSVRGAGDPNNQIPVCECFVSQMAGEKGSIRRNEFSLRQKKDNFEILDADFREDEENE